MKRVCLCIIPLNIWLVDRLIKREVRAFIRWFQVIYSTTFFGRLAWLLVKMRCLADYGYSHLCFNSVASFWTRLKVREACNVSASDLRCGTLADTHFDWLTDFSRKHIGSTWTSTARIARRSSSLISSMRSRRQHLSSATFPYQATRSNAITPITWARSLAMVASSSTRIAQNYY